MSIDTHVNINVILCRQINIELNAQRVAPSTIVALDRSFLSKCRRRRRERGEKEFDLC